MDKEQVIKWVKQNVDLFTMYHGGQPEQMMVTKALWEFLDHRSHWLDIPIGGQPTYGARIRMELWRGNEAAIYELAEIHLKQ